MEKLVNIPVFPLSIFPLPGELVPLHIFEPRYRQLLEDAEARDIAFGIYFNHVANTGKLGSFAKLEHIVKRYPGGESDIIVKCSDLFAMSTLFRTYSDKLYPGGDVRFWNVSLTESVSQKLTESFMEYLTQIKINRHQEEFSAYHIAIELSLDFEERLQFVQLDHKQKELFLLSRLKYQKQLLSRADTAKDIFHLN